MRKMGWPDAYLAVTKTLLAQNQAVHDEVKGDHGWPRMHKGLLTKGIHVGKDRVRKLMQQHGGIRVRKNR